MEFCFAL